MIIKSENDLNIYILKTLILEKKCKSNKWNFLLHLNIGSKFKFSFEFYILYLRTCLLSAFFFPYSRFTIGVDIYFYFYLLYLEK